jgi:hypothetical protein
VNEVWGSLSREGENSSCVLEGRTRDNIYGFFEWRIGDRGGTRAKE